MKNRAYGEDAMREAEVSCPQSMESLIEYINDLIGVEKTFGTGVYAASMAAVATFYYVSQRVNLSGFQKSIADLDILRRTRRIGCPFILLQADALLEPDGLQFAVNRHLPEWLPWAAAVARRNLYTAIQDAVDPKLWAHWEELSKADEPPKEDKDS